MPRISIVMPVYNGEKYLREAIDSILAQTFTDWEFIIINEFGSNEATTSILREYAQKDRRFIIVQNTERLGIAASMNIGLDMAKGEYIARMDADDISLPKRLEKQVEFMDSHPEIDICGIKPTLFGENVWDWKVESDPQILKSSILFFTPFVHPTVMMRTARLNQFRLRYNPDYRYTEDYDFFARASEFLIFTNIQDASLYRYRMHSQNATSAGGNQGVMLYRSVTKRLAEDCGLAISEHDADLLCIHTYPRSDKIEQALDDLAELDILLKRLFFSDAAREKYGTDPLFRALHIRWMRVEEDMRAVGSVTKNKRFQSALNRGLFFYSDFYRNNDTIAVKNPKVSIVMPTYNSEKFIADTVYSLLNQTYRNFEMIIVNEFGPDDDTVKIIHLFQDPRIKIIQNKTHLGLAESLNEGIRQASGEYIARADADDLYPPYRLEKQVAFLDSHPDISVCGSWQQHFGKRDSIHKPPETPEEMKAQLLFTCDVCHSTVMLRKSDFVENNLWYDPAYLSEDFELWSRAVQKLKFATIQEILGEYRWDGENITVSKMSRLDAEAQKIIAGTLKKQLKIEIPKDDLVLLSGWFNPFQDSARSDRKELVERELDLLTLIEHNNRQSHVYDENALHETLQRRRRWAEGTDWRERVQQVTANHLTFSQIVKKLLKKILMPFYRPVKHRVSDRFDQLRQQLWDMDGHICDVKEDVRQHDLAVKKFNDRLEYLEQRLAEQTKLVQELSRFDGLNEQLKKSENNILQTMDGRAWKAELNIKHDIRSDIWNLRYHLDKSFDNLLPQTEKHTRSNNIYNECFYEDNRYGSVMSAIQVWHVLLSRLTFIHSIADFGCGTGTWLYVAKQFGIEKVIGIDGDYIRPNWLMIDRTEFVPFNLENYISLKEKPDMAISLEVAEHIDEQYADVLIDNLCNNSDVILFSAAHPGQGGDSHVNEQPFSYWKEKFNKRMYRLIEIRPLFQNNVNMESWYKENIGLYVKLPLFDKIKTMFI